MANNIIMPEFFKDPNAVLDYKWDWKAVTNGSSTSLGDWLDTGETISTYTVTVPSGLTLDSDSKTDTNTSITAWLSGGTHNTDYVVACRIVTSESRTDERSIIVKVRNR